MEDLRTIPRHEHFCCGLSNLAPKEKIGYSGYIEEDAGQHKGLLCVLLLCDMSGDEKNKKYSKRTQHCTVAWVTRPERPKGVKDFIKHKYRNTNTNTNTPRARSHNISSIAPPWNRPFMGI